MTAAASAGCPGLAWLWYGFLGPPVIWAVKFMAGYAIVPAACSAGGLLWLNVVTLVAAAGTVMAGVAAVRVLQHARLHRDNDDEPRRRRTRFMATAGLFTSGLFLAAIIAEGLANVLVDPCLGSGAVL